MDLSFNYIRNLKRGCIAILGLVIVQFSCLSAAEYSSEPIIHSVFPLGGQIGQTFPIKLRGEYLNESYALWFASDSISATNSWSAALLKFHFFW